jgi:hypothetical protein
MRSFGGLLAIFAIACAPSPPPLRTAGPAESQTAIAPRVASSIRVLPAGIFFRGHTYRPCDHIDESEQAASGLCIEPKAAVVSGVFARARDAERALEQARSLALAPGYPFAAHSDELGLADASRQGTAIVLGLFESSRDAGAWLADHAIEGAERVALLDAEAAFDRHDQSPQRFAVMIDAEGPVPAYAARHFEWRDDREPEGVVPGRTQPLCHVRPGALFVATATELQGTWYDFAPVRCGSELAYVEWTKTRLTATIWKRSSGATELLQIVDVSCDRPTFEAWTVDRDGHRQANDATPDARIAMTPC